MYSALSEAYGRSKDKGYQVASQDLLYVQAHSHYEDSAVRLEALLGPSAHCSAVDCDLWSSYSDTYKEEAGFRHHRTRAEVQDYLRQLRAAMPSS